MTADYKLRIYDGSNQLQAEVTDFLALQYVRVVNEPGLLVFVLPGEHSAIEYLTLNAQVEVWRRDLDFNIPWTREFVGIFKDEERQQAGPFSSFKASCPGVLTLLSERIVAWYAETSNRSSFSGAAETVMKTLVDYNAGSNATVVNGRIRNGTITGLTIETDGGRGSSIEIKCAWDNLLSTLQEIALIGGGDFDLVKEDNGDLNFRWYSNQRGSDRSAEVTFSTLNGNIANPVYRKIRSSERTVAIVGGGGEQDNRTVEVVTGDSYSTGNNSEFFADSRNSTSGLSNTGQAKLKESSYRETLEFEVLQTPSSMYGVHYFVGDIVTANYQDISVQLKINKVAVTLDSNGNQTIDIDMGTY